MPTIRPVLIVGAGDQSELAAALRARGLGAMLAADVEQAARLLRNFRVDVAVAVCLPIDDVRKLSSRTLSVVIGGSEAEAWAAGAAGFAPAETAAAVITDVVYQVSRGERRVRAQAEPEESRGIA